MKDGSGEQVYKQFSKGMSEKDIVVGMVQTLEELKALEMLFRNPKRAVEEMNKEGMIPKKNLDTYLENPALLEDDTRKSLHFTFVSIAAAGGYLWELFRFCFVDALRIAERTVGE